MKLSKKLIQVIVICCVCNLSKYIHVPIQIDIFISDATHCVCDSIVQCQIAVCINTEHSEVNTYVENYANILVNKLVQAFAKLLVAHCPEIMEFDFN